MATPEATKLIEPVSGRDHTRGPRSGEVSLVEYGDFECPYCRAAEPIIAGLVQVLGDHLSVTFRHFPMSAAHPHATHAAEVAEAAALQGRFWEMHDKLYQNQNALEDEDLLRYAEQLGLNADRVRRELVGGEHTDRVRADFKDGVRSGVNGTPTFYIDGTRYDGPVALRDILAAIRGLHPNLEAAGTAANPRIPRVRRPRRPGAVGA